MATQAALRPMSDTEWAAHQELASCYRVRAYMGWDELIFDHITLKVPGEEGVFLINPFGLHFSEVTATSLVIPENVLAVHQRDLHLAQVSNRPSGQAASDAMVRLVDREERSWRD